MFHVGLDLNLEESSWFDAVELTLLHADAQG